MNKTKAIIATIGVAGAIVGGSAGITEININAFKSDLIVLEVQEEQAQHLAEYFKGNSLWGKRETVTIQEMQAMNRIYDKAVKKAGGQIGEVNGTKDLIKKLNSLVGELAEVKKSN